MSRDNLDIEKEILLTQLGIEREDILTDTETAEKEVPPKKKQEEKMDLYDFVQSVITAAVFGIIVFVFIFRIIGVDGTSMYATLCNGDRVIVSDLFYTPKQGDIIILKSEMYDKPLVKRVIATENQTVDIDFINGVVTVDGVELDEPYIYEKTHVDEGFTGPVTVPEGCVFVMGDNRNNSNDSRLSTIGFIDEREIFGKVYFIIFPGLDKNKEQDWSRIGSVY